MGFPANPAAEAEGIELVGLLVGLNARRDHRPAVIGGLEPFVTARGGQVGVGDMPLAAVVGVVATGSKPVPHGWHVGGIQPAHRRVVVGLGQAIGFGHPMQGGVVPSEQGGPAGQAGSGSGVVALQLKAS